MIVDCHVHFSEEDGFARDLAKESRRLGIEHVVLLGGHWNGKSVEGGLLNALRRHKGFYSGFGMLRLGDDHPEAVDAFREAGFRGLKCIRPRSRYDDQAYYRIYERAEALGMVMLFHLGIVARGPEDKYRGVNNDFMRPVHLDTIARAFPDLTLIGAHFGNPWSDEAAMIARWNPNVFFDLSGSLLKYRPPEFFRQLLWWGGDQKQYQAPDGSQPWDKIVFGSDVSIELIHDVMNDYRSVMGALELSEAQQSRVMGDTMAGLLRLR